jgi:hypothetical protein
MPLSKSERRVVKAIGQTIFPRGGAIDVDAVEAGVVEYVEDYVERLPPWNRVQMRALFFAFDRAFGINASQPGRRFVDAHPDERRVFLDSWEHSSNYYQRMLWAGLRMVLTLAYAEAPGVKVGMGEAAPPEADVETEPKQPARLRKLS